MSLILVSCTPIGNQELELSGEIGGESKESGNIDGTEEEKTSDVDVNEFEDKYRYNETVTKPIKLEITNKPNLATYLLDRGRMDMIPKFNPADTNPFLVDFRGFDLSHLVIGKDQLEDLKEGSFNTATIWPKNLPEGFNPMETMEMGKNPGLNIRVLHKQGITGKGIGIAIIDQKLLVEHSEYRDQLMFYEEINCDDEYNMASMHGPTVASIAVGKTVGVAPEADLYYIAETHGEYKEEGFEWDFTWLAMSIDRILEVNKTLPDDRKIRVISISVGWSPDRKGYKETMEAVKRAKEQGVFIISSSLEETYGLKFHGLGRLWNADPDDYNSYTPGSWWAGRFYSPVNQLDKTLLVPMDKTTTASPIGDEAYVYYSQGGWSWSIPYIAGLYALACQVNPDITPKEFWATALKTGDTVELEKDGKKYKLEKIVNPVKLIEELKVN